VAGQAPLIGISIGSHAQTDTGANTLTVRSTYIRAVDAAGGIPVLIPLFIPPDRLRQLHERLSGILLTGGGDIDPSYYGAEMSPFTAGIDTARDEVEFQLVRWAIEDNKPLLGICRGHQMLNVALGGTLIQDIREEIKNALRHDLMGDEWFSRKVHDVTVQAGSKLQEALAIAETYLTVNSLHHQAVNEVGAGLEMVGRADDGVIEALEMPGQRFVVSVQWHPEALFEQNYPHRHLFEAFVRAARG
jgi:putative glutamine amidotransferase